MKQSEHNEKFCPVAQSLGVIGDSWSLLILRNSFFGTKRFDEFQSELGLTRHVLADRLKKMVSFDIMKKVPINPQATRFEYQLTQKGKELRPVLMTLATWGNKWLSEEGQQNMYYVHEACGHISRPTLCCSHCGESMEVGKIHIRHADYVVEQTKNMSPKDQVAAFGFKPKFNS